MEETAVNLTVFSKTGASIGEFIDAQFLSAMWRLGNSGVARYSFPRNGNKVSRCNLRPGNRVLIQFSDDLPNWGGVIDFPINYSSDGDLVLSFYEGERLLDWRISGANEAYETAVGSIAQGLVESANAAAQSGVNIGDIYTGGTSQSRAFHYISILDAIVGLAGDSGYDYAVVPTMVGGKLYLDLCWYERRGSDKRETVRLEEGKNVGKVAVSEQGTVVNSVTVLGKGEEDWAKKPKATTYDATSVSRYGLREGALFYFDTSDETTLQAIADAFLESSKEPRRSYIVNGVTNTNPAGFAEYGVGDIVHLVALHDWGDFAIDDAVRIHSRSRMQDGTCVLEAKRWEGD